MRRRLLIAVSLLVLLAGTLCLSLGTGRRITRANFEKIKDGMSREAVDGLLGKEFGRKTGARLTVEYVLYSEQASGSLLPANAIQVKFTDGKVIGKAFRTWTVADWWKEVRHRVSPPALLPPAPAPQTAAKSPRSGQPQAAGDGP
jgi:hypothetical protein